jgi:predicted nucleic acid-binding Zn ribbon protein
MIDCRQATGVSRSGNRKTIMPQYEYICEDDGEIITLLRPMRDADKPVEDPAGQGRTFKRMHSTFMVSESAASKAKSNAKPATRPGGGCACGNPHGPCGM